MATRPNPATPARPDLRIVILRLKNARHLDATSVMALEELIRFLRSTARQLIISGATQEVYGEHAEEVKHPNAPRPSASLQATPTGPCPLMPRSWAARA